MKTIGFLLLVVTAACGGDDGPSTIDGPRTPDARVIDADPAPDAECFTNPTTHNEIINACTTPDVVKIDKRPVLPLLEPDGTLPPLP